MRQRALSVPWVCCDTPMPQKMIAARALAYLRATVRITSAPMPQIGSMASGVNFSRWTLSFSKPSVWAWIYWVS